MLRYYFSNKCIIKIYRNQWFWHKRQFSGRNIKLLARKAKNPTALYFAVRLDDPLYLYLVIIFLKSFFMISQQSQSVPLLRLCRINSAAAIHPLAELLKHMGISRSAGLHSENGVATKGLCPLDPRKLCSA